MRREVVRAGYRSPDSLPGVKTVVSPESEKNLPNRMDDEPQVNLPPGSATPQSPKKNDNDNDIHGKGMPEGGGGGGTRSIPKPEYNTPDSTSDIVDRPRTTGVPGQQYGHPSKDDYNYVTRRTMEATEIEAYERKIPWRRQTKQRMLPRLEDRRYYRKNRRQILRDSLKWYKRVRRNPVFRHQKELREERPQKYKRKKIGMECLLVPGADLLVLVEVQPDAVLFQMEDGTSLEIEPEEALRNVLPLDEADDEQYIDAIGKIAYSGLAPGQRRHKQRGLHRLERHHSYLRNRNRAHRKSHIWYNRYHNHPKFKRRQSLRKRNPVRYKLRYASLLTTPEVAFVVGPDMTLGYIHKVSPMTGMITFSLDGPDVPHILSLPTMAFLSSVVFLSEEDIEAAYSLIDEEAGAAAYSDVLLDDVKTCVAMHGMAWDDPRLRAACGRIVEGAVTPEDMASPDLANLLGAVAVEIMDQAELPEVDPGRNRDDGEEGLIEGRVAHRVASRFLQSGDVVLYDKSPPGDLPQNWRERKEPTRDVENPDRSYREDGPDRWTNMPPGATRKPTAPDVPEPDGSLYSPASGKVVPPGEGIDISAATIAEILDNTGRDVLNRSRGISVRLSKADPKRGIWTYKVSGSKNREYTVRVKGVRSGNVLKMSAADVLVSCDCDFFRWQGPEHWAKVEGFLYGRPRGTAATPAIKDPHGKHWVCKHIAAVLPRLVQTGMMDRMASRVADRHIEAVMVSTDYGRSPLLNSVRWRLL